MPTTAPKTTCSTSKAIGTIMPSFIPNGPGAGTSFPSPMRGCIIGIIPIAIPARTPCPAPKMAPDARDASTQSINKVQRIKLESFYLIRRKPRMTLLKSQVKRSGLVSCEWCFESILSVCRMGESRFPQHGRAVGHGHSSPFRGVRTQIAWVHSDFGAYSMCPCAQTKEAWFMNAHLPYLLTKKEPRHRNYFRDLNFGELP